jgi:hypothetical protein
MSAKVKKKHSAQFLQALIDIRAHIIIAWRGLVGYLQEIPSFGDEIGFGPSEVDRKTSDDLTWPISVKAMNMARELSNATSSAQDAFHNHKASITKLLPADLSSLPRNRQLLAALPYFELTGNPTCKCLVLLR